MIDIICPNILYLTHESLDANNDDLEDSDDMGQLSFYHVVVIGIIQNQ